MSTITVPKIPRRFTHRHKTTHWGIEYLVKPAVVSEALGDGRLLLWVQPLSTRPDYYLIRIDSKWIDLNGDEFRDYVQSEILDAITEEYSEKEREREYLEEDLAEEGIAKEHMNLDLDGNEARLGWPVLDLDCGFAWGVEARHDGRYWRKK